MITKTDTLLSKALVEKKQVTEDILKPLLDEAAKSKETFFQLLLKKDVVTEEVLLKDVSELLRLPFLSLAELRPLAGVTEKVPLKIAEYYRFVPLKLDKRKLTVAVSSPLDLRTQDDIRAQLGYELEMVLAREKDIVEAAKTAYGFAAGTIGEIISSQSQAAAPAAEAAFEKIENIEKLAGDASIAKLVNQIILEAYKKRATDIHVEPYRGKVKLRYRIDGILYNAKVQPEMNRLIQPILSRIKIMSNLNIVERRLPQDGRAIVKVEDTQLDLRVSCIPTPYGESVVIRMLPMNRIFDMAQLGLGAEQKKIFDELLAKPHGVIFITGPTGSGKSTTLYACLNKLNTDDRKIITIEDPVEYEMDGVTQIQVVSAIGLDFAKGLRSMLRHDPDVMMVGEVRDLETAEMAIRVALTGHLVFSTLHTNDAASGVTRLVDIGIQPYLVASSVEAFMAQRLVRRICPHCREEDLGVSKEMKEVIARELGTKYAPVKIYRGKGCDQCNDTGFWGRIAIFEVLLMSENLRRLVMKRAASSDLKRQAIQEGMRTLRQDGWRKVLEGLTTPAEVLEATQGDEEFPGLAEGGASSDGKKNEFVSAVKEYDFQSATLKNHGRFFVRLQKNVNLSYRIVKLPDIGGYVSEDAPYKRSVAKNISAGGLLFVAQDRVPPGTILELRVELPAVDKPIECLAKTLRATEVDTKKVYEVAVCFLDLSAARRTQLDKFVMKEQKAS